MSFGSKWGQETLIAQTGAAAHSITGLQDGTLLAVYRVGNWFTGKVLNADGTETHISGVLGTFPSSSSTIVNLSVEALSGNRFQISYTDISDVGVENIVTKTFKIGSDGQISAESSYNGTSEHGQTALGTTGTSSGGFMRSYATAVGDPDLGDYARVLRIEGWSASGHKPFASIIET